jgi:hypothetical protein
LADFLIDGQLLLSDFYTDQKRYQVVPDLGAVQKQEIRGNVVVCGSFSHRQLNRSSMSEMDPTNVILSIGCASPLSFKM